MTALPSPLYERLAAARWPRTYAGKLMLIPFLAIHLPLMGVLTYAALTSEGWSSMAPLLLVVLLLTLAGSGLAYLALRSLLGPVHAATEALESFQANHEAPSLPTGYDDEAGRLLRQTQHTLEQLHRLLSFKSRLLRVMSHDVRTPLSSIIMAIDTIQHETARLNGEGHVIGEMATIISESAHYQMGMLENLLSAMQADSTQFQIRADKITLHTLVDLVRNDARLLAEDKTIVVRSDLRDVGHMILHTDVTKLRQVINNLLSNAIKFSPRGSEVLVGAARSGESLLLYVEDHGIGIPSDQRAHLFEPFTDARRAGTEKEQGFGLGLWVSKTFTELLGGSLAVESQPHEGTTFIVHFPLEAVEDGEV